MHHPSLRTALAQDLKDLVEMTSKTGGANRWELSVVTYPADIHAVVEMIREGLVPAGKARMA